MRFEWPELLWLLAVLPVLGGLALWLLRRRRPAVPAWAAAAAVPRRRGDALRRALPPTLLVAGLAAMVVGASRPHAYVTMPAANEVVILAIDVSGSMRARDVEPDRLTVAQGAARSFVDAQPLNTKVGVVAFAATASVLQAPTHDREAVFAALERVRVQKATAIGSGLLVSLKAIFPDVKIDLNDAPAGARRDARAPRARGEGPAGAATRGDGVASAPPAAAPVEPGSVRAAAIVLLSDGESSMGPDPIEAARQVAQRGVRVYTVGFGTPAGTTLKADGWAMRVRLDEPTLRRIADITLGEYYQAASAAELKKVYGRLSAKLSVERAPVEVSGLFAAAGALLALLGGALSMLWYGRIV